MGYPIKMTHELRRFLCLLLLNINYLQYHFYQNHAEKIMNFEHPTFQCVNAMVIRNPGCFPGLCAFGVHYRAQVKSEI